MSSEGSSLLELSESGASSEQAKYGTIETRLDSDHVRRCNGISQVSQTRVIAKILDHCIGQYCGSVVLCICRVL